MNLENVEKTKNIERAFFSVAEIAAEMGARHSRVAYVIKTRGVQPITRVGVSRLFSSEAAERIKAACREIDETEARRLGRQQPRGAGAGR